MLIVKTRILLIGFERPLKPMDGEEIREVSVKRPISGIWHLDKKLPPLYGHHIVVISPLLFGVHGWWYDKDMRIDDRDIKEQIKLLLNANYGGIIVIPIKKGEKYFWCPASKILIHDEGEAFKLNEKHYLYSFMEKYIEKGIFKWQAYTDPQEYWSEEERRCIIATNLVGLPVSFEILYGNGRGRMIFLPYFSVPEKLEGEFLRDLINKIRPLLKKKEIKAPSWVNNPKYMFKDEIKIEEKINKLKKERRKFERIRSILWLDGYELTEAVAFVLSELGIKCELKEYLRKEDIEIDEDELHGIVEVKGLKKYATAKDIRELLDWYTEKLNEDENVKGIFILNDFKEIEPDKRSEKAKELLKDRDYPFTKDAERVAVNNNFCLLTTYQLYLIFKDVINGRLNKDELIRKIKETAGIFRYP